MEETIKFFSITIYFIVILFTTMYRHVDLKQDFIRSCAIGLFWLPIFIYLICKECVIIVREEFNI